MMYPSKDTEDSAAGDRLKDINGKVMDKNMPPSKKALLNRKCLSFANKSW
jgi:hypothetical protein